MEQKLKTKCISNIQFHESSPNTVTTRDIWDGASVSIIHVHKSRHNECVYKERFRSRFHSLAEGQILEEAREDLVIIHAFVVAAYSDNKIGDRISVHLSRPQL